jgi:hypothetical protein
MKPPDNSRHRIESITNDMLSRIYEPPETDVAIIWLDEQGKPHEQRLERTSRPGKTPTAMAIDFPPTFVEFESKRQSELSNKSYRSEGEE